jgi:hypothetical protein
MAVGSGPGGRRVGAGPRANLVPLPAAGYALLRYISRNRAAGQPQQCGECHWSGTFSEGRVSGYIFEKTLQTGSPLTESNRRPSPYHPQLPGFTAARRGRWAKASSGQTAAVTYRAAGNVTRRGPGRARRGWRGQKRRPSAFRAGSWGRGPAGHGKARRSDDGQMIMLRVQLRLEHTTEQCSSIARPIRTTRLLSASGPQVRPGNPAGIDQRQTGPH